MLSFSVDQQKCNKCGQCVEDCPAKTIAMADGFPAVASEMEDSCYRCQHCLAICPTAAVSIMGLDPQKSPPLAGSFPAPKQLEALIKGRRSVRRYQEENLDPALMQHLLDVAWHAPTGVNSRQVRFTVVDDRAKMARLRDDIMKGIGRLVREDALPEAFARFAGILQAWEEQGVDVIFRDAPHLLIASAPRQVATPQADCLIALSYFELYAQANEVGTVWGGLAKYAIDDLLPETRKALGIPEDHLVGYAMIFGKPAVHYPRGVQHGPALIHRV
jgi:nitroreductase/NAD-dependent dihydropyrimidine dehydrogenase PreA subunit